MARVPSSPLSQEYWLAVPCIPLIQPLKCCLWPLTQWQVAWVSQDCPRVTRCSEEILKTGVSRLGWKWKSVLRSCFESKSLFCNRNVDFCFLLFWRLSHLFSLAFIILLFCSYLYWFYLLILWQQDFFSYLMHVHLCTNEHKGNMGFQEDSQVRVVVRF